MIDYDKARQHVMIMLKGEEKVSSEVIQEKVRIVRNMVAIESPDSSIDWETLVRDIESRCNVWIGAGTVLEYHEDHKPWLPDRRSQIQWKFWKRYERYLEEEKGWGDKTVRKLGEFTDQIIERLEDPLRPGEWDRKGMVVGQVQSGKTSNYTGLICKAVDAGYKLIIVLAGQHKSLRSQTQLRLDEEFLGFDTQLNRAFNQENLRIGVGRLIGEEFLTVHSLTSNADNGDFNKKVAIQVGVVPGGGDPVLLVVKKNKSVLSNLLNWAVSVRGEKDPETGKKIVRRLPLLVIDDEADNASINTNPIPHDDGGKILEDYDVTAINGLIRQLLDSFEKTAYVGYTATPFANIFIFPQGETNRHGKDLFPESFIINLPAPTNYTGPTKVFGIDRDEDAGIESEEGLPIIRIVDDFETFIPNNHRKELIPPGIPDSLRTAMRAFILSCAARMARGHDKNHNSMLVHVTRFTDVQKKVAELVNDELTFLRHRLEYGDGNSSEPLLAELESLWREDYFETTKKVKERIQDPMIKDIEWNDVRQNLYRAADKIQLKIINGTARDILDYRDHTNGLNVIVIGGDKLSRGLTLEGLTVSYYLRASRMYDTLMQMGRWFGYRPGYVDLCRLYTSEELVTWYKYITLASEELRNDFDDMAALGSTPKDYGLRVRTHPEGLLVTAVNKMRSGTEMELSYDGHLIETVVFHTDNRTIESNYNVIDGFIHERGTCSDRDKKIWRNVPGANIIQLLREIIVHPESRMANPEILRQYIEAQMENNELNHWTVALISNTKSTKIPSIIGGHEVGLSYRKNATDRGEKYSMTKGHLISPTDEMIDLSEEQISRAKQEMKEITGKSPENPSGRFIRNVRSPENGLLLIYPLDPEPASASKPVMGLAFSFPVSSSARKIKYRVNNVYWEQEFSGHND